MYTDDMFIQMRTTLNVDADLLGRAAKLTGVTEKTSLVRMGLEALIARESARCLAQLGGTEKKLSRIQQKARGPGGMTLVDTSVWVDHLRSGSASG